MEYKYVRRLKSLIYIYILLIYISQKFIKKFYAVIILYIFFIDFYIWNFKSNYSAIYMNSIVRNSSCNPLVILIIFVQIIKILVQINEFNHISFFELIIR